MLTALTSLLRVHRLWLHGISFPSPFPSKFPGRLFGCASKATPQQNRLLHHSNIIQHNPTVNHVNPSFHGSYASHLTLANCKG